MVNWKKWFLEEDEDEIFEEEKKVKLLAAYGHYEDK